MIFTNKISLDQLLNSRMILIAMQCIKQTRSSRTSADAICNWRSCLMIDRPKEQMNNRNSWRFEYERGLTQEHPTGQRERDSIFTSFCISRFIFQSIFCSRSIAFDSFFALFLSLNFISPILPIVFPPSFFFSFSSLPIFLGFILTFFS